MPVERRCRTILWWGLSLLVLAILLLPALHDGIERQPFEWTLLTVALILWGTAVYAAWKRGRERLVRRLVWLHLATAVVLAYGNPAPDEVSWDRPVEVTAMALLPALFYSFFHRLAVGEGGREAARTMTRLLWLGGIGSGALLLVTGSGPTIILNHAARLLLFASLLAGFAGGLVTLFRGYRHPRSEHQRRQLQAVLVGASLAVLPIITLYLLPGVLGREAIIPPQAAALSLTFLPLSLAYAVLRHRLFDMDAVVNRGLVYAIMTVLLAGSYVPVFEFINRVHADGLVDDTIRLAFFAVVAATFAPLQGRVRVLIDRAIYRDRYDYARTLRELGGHLASVQPLERVLPTITQRLAEAMNLRGAAILLRGEDGSLHVRASFGDPSMPREGTQYPLAGAAVNETDGARWLPLRAHGERAGFLYLGPKRLPADFSAEDVTLAKLADDVNRSEPLEVSFSHERFPDRYRLPKEMEDALYHVVRQALDNVRRHARATRVHVDLGVEEAQAVLNVRDDGCGFAALPPAATLLRRGHLGVIGMRDRIEALGGVFAVASEPGAGTEIRARVPLPRPAEEAAPGRGAVE